MGKFLVDVSWRESVEYTASILVEADSEDDALWAIDNMQPDEVPARLVCCNDVEPQYYFDCVDSCESDDKETDYDANSGRWLE